MTALRQFQSLLHEEQWVEHNAVADDVYLAALKDARWNTSQHILLSVELQSVASIRSTLKTCYDVIAWCKNIYHLAFTLVAPLEAEHYIYFLHMMND